MNYELIDDIAVITMDDGKANAVSYTMMESLNSHLDQAEKEAKAVVLLGKSGMYSAGFDLKEVQKGPEAANALVNTGAHLFHRLYGFPMPLIGGCTGHAIAAGAFLILCCDTRVGVSGDFKLGLNETAIGMTLPVFGYEIAQSRLSKRHLTAAVIQATMFDPDAAIDAGFLDEVVEADHLQARCLEIATQLSALPKQTYGQMKRGVRQSSLEKIEASLR